MCVRLERGRFLNDHPASIVIPAKAGIQATIKLCRAIVMMSWSKEISCFPEQFTTSPKTTFRRRSESSRLAINAVLMFWCGVAACPSCSLTQGERGGVRGLVSRLFSNCGTRQADGRLDSRLRGNDVCVGSRFSFKMWIRVCNLYEIVHFFIFLTRLYASSM